MFPGVPGRAPRDPVSQKSNDSRPRAAWDNLRFSRAVLFFTALPSIFFEILEKRSLRRAVGVEVMGPEKVFDPTRNAHDLTQFTLVNDKIRFNLLLRIFVFFF